MPNESNTPDLFAPCDFVVKARETLSSGAKYMTRIAEHTSRRLVVESKPRLAFGIMISLGLLATSGALFAAFNQSKALSTDDIFGIILGPLFIIGGLLFYRETTTVFDKHLRLVNWKQRGLTVNKSDSARFSEIKDVVVGRPVSDQSGGATSLVLVLSDRYWPLSFGFSALNYQNKEIIEAIRGFIDDRHS